MCYANANMKLVKKNQKLHNPDSPLLGGEANGGDVVKEILESGFIDTQTGLFQSISSWLKFFKKSMMFMCLMPFCGWRVLSIDNTYFG